MSSKLGYHFQSIPDWAKQPGAINAEYVKLINPPSENPFPLSKVLGRTYMDDAEANALVMRGNEGGRLYFEAMRHHYDNARYVHAWLAPNEPPVATSYQRRALADFTISWASLMHSVIRKPVIGLNLSVGWPDIGTALELRSAILACDGWALHEYGYPTLQSNASWWCLRYRRTVAELGGSPRPLFILELGIDKAVAVNGPHLGYLDNTSRSDYLSQLAWYDSEIQRDSYVVCATPFVSGANSDWITFDVDEPMAHLLNQHIATSGGGAKPPVVLPPPTSSSHGEIRAAAFKTLSVPYTPGHALYRYAAQQGLGAPLSEEFVVGNTVCQCYAKCIVYCEIGQWLKVMEVSY